jgi:hypothetical protein
MARSPGSALSARAPEASRCGGAAARAPPRTAAIVAVGSARGRLQKAGNAVRVVIGLIVVCYIVGFTRRHWPASKITSNSLQKTAVFM